MFGKLDWVAKVNAAKFQFKNEHQSSMGGCLASSDESLNYSLFGNRRCTRPLCPAKLSLMFSIMSQRMFSIKIQQIISIKIPQMFSIMIPQELDMHLKTALGQPALSAAFSSFCSLRFDSAASLSFIKQKPPQSFRENAKEPYLRVFLAKMLLARSVGIIFQSSYWHFKMCFWILQPNKYCIHPALHTAHIWSQCQNSQLRSVTT